MVVKIMMNTVDGDVDGDGCRCLKVSVYGLIPGGRFQV